MTKRVQVVLMLIVALAMMGLASCGHYTCGANFGNSTCAAGPLSLSGNGQGSTAAAFVFVSNGTASPGGIVGYTLNTNAVPPTLEATANFTSPTTPGFDSGIGIAVAQKQFLYTAFGKNGGQIYGWTISTVGVLTPVANSPYSVPLLATGATATFDIARMITNPAGTLLFLGDEFGFQIFVYQIGAGGVLTAAGSPVLVPFSPGNMTTDGLGKYLYVTDTSAGNHTGSQIAAYSIGATGTLTAVAGSPFTGASYAMWQVEGEPTGKYLIGTTGNSAAPGLGLSGIDDNHLYLFSINPSGAIAPAVGSPFATTYSPLSIAVQSDAAGNLVDSFGYDALGTGFNPVESFALSSSGTVSVVNGSPFLNAAVGTEGKFDQSGGLLFVYGGIFNPTDNTVVYTVTGFEQSGTNLNTPTGIGTYGGYWVATDAP
jgi:hypothetical protein